MTGMDSANSSADDEFLQTHGFMEPFLLQPLTLPVLGRARLVCRFWHQALDPMTQRRVAADPKLEGMTQCKRRAVGWLVGALRAHPLPYSPVTSPISLFPCRRPVILEYVHEERSRRVKCTVSDHQLIAACRYGRPDLLAALTASWPTPSRRLYPFLVRASMAAGLGDTQNLAWLATAGMPLQTLHHVLWDELQNVCRHAHTEVAVPLMDAPSFGRVAGHALASGLPCDHLFSKLVDVVIKQPKTQDQLLKYMVAVRPVATPGAVKTAIEYAVRMDRGGVVEALQTGSPPTRQSQIKHERASFRRNLFCLGLFLAVLVVVLLVWNWRPWGHERRQAHHRHETRQPKHRLGGGVYRRSRHGRHRTPL